MNFHETNFPASPNEFTGRRVFVTSGTKGEG